MPDIRHAIISDLHTSAREQPHELERPSWFNPFD